MNAANLRYGELVQIIDEAHGCFGRVGQYEGVISEDLDALRVRFPGGVIVASRAQLCAYQHPVCAHRRIRAKAIRQSRERVIPRPACYSKDYGKTTVELIEEIWDNASPDEPGWLDLYADVVRAHRAEYRRPVRHYMNGVAVPLRLNREMVAKRRDPETSNERRWLRTRRALRAVAWAQRSAS